MPAGAGLVFMAGSLLAAPTAGPRLGKAILFRAGQDGFTLYRIPGKVVTPKGTALAYCEAGAGNLRFTLNIACAHVRDAQAQAGDRSRMVLASASGKTPPEMQRPVAEVGADLTALKKVHAPVVLGGGMPSLMRCSKTCGCCGRQLTNSH